MVRTGSNGDLENQAMTRELCSTATERGEVNFLGGGGPRARPSGRYLVRIATLQAGETS